MQKLRDFVIEYNKVPTTREIKNNPNYPNDETYRERFGNFKNALIKAGIEISQDKQWLYEREEYSEKELLDKFKLQVDKHLKETGKLLISDDIDRIKDIPSANCYYKKFGTLDNIYKAIGIDRVKFNNDKLEEDMKQKYIEIRNILSRTPNSRDMEYFSRTNDNYYYACATYIHHFKSITNFQILMGDEPTTTGNTTMGENL